MPPDFDLVVTGGGLVGAACALALRESGLRLALVEAAVPPMVPPDDSWDSRIYAISPGNADFLSRLGVWQTLDQARITPIEEMRIWGDDGDAHLDFSAYGSGVATLGYIVESRLLQAGLWTGLRDSLEITLISPAQGAGLVLEDDRAVLTLADGRTLTSRLIVGADGGASWTRGQAGMAVATTDYRQMGVVANFAATKPHGNMARQWFRADGILAWLPLPGRRISMVWSTTPEQAKTLLTLQPGALAQTVAQAGQEALGDLQLLTPAAAYPLKLQNAESLVRPRLALVGDAAHLVHPLAGQGVNLGFHDAECLARVLIGRGLQTDVGDYALLRRYERARQLDIRAMQAITGSLHALFGSDFPGVGSLRNRGLGFINRQQWLKRRLMAHAMT
ncbi:2-octaprenylphenol hydroxylase [mine drainage metagenome]|uniref:2-octaprenylphenol hydroxylase n=1 Tax=mine drainage metagenome TaxID=410659 RepID=A0A1J5QEQ0_9ZZZZ